MIYRIARLTHALKFKLIKLQVKCFVLEIMLFIHFNDNFVEFQYLIKKNIDPVKTSGP